MESVEVIREGDSIQHSEPTHHELEGKIHSLLYLPFAGSLERIIIS
jgi:hypothetical protein